MGLVFKGDDVSQPCAVIGMSTAPLTAGMTLP
jgi:hypothetical protein